MNGPGRLRRSARLGAVRVMLYAGRSVVRAPERVEQGPAGEADVPGLGRVERPADGHHALVDVLEVEHAGQAVVEDELVHDSPPRSVAVVRGWGAAISATPGVPRALYKALVAD